MKSASNPQHGQANQRQHQKPSASLSLDLDNQWSYMKTHGDAGWEAFPSYLEVVIPRFLDFLQARDLTITVFIVGQDAALPQHADVLRQIATAGHEIGNHSFRHEPWLHLYPEPEIEDELARAETHIEAATGCRPRGFRGPGYSLLPTTLQVLKRRGYAYDASTFPTFIGPLARAYYFMTSRFEPEEREQRKLLFGTLRDGLRPLKPYQWRLHDDTLLEIPVTTMPLLRMPIHLSYLLYLSAMSSALAASYFNTALAFCRWTGTAPSLLLHPLDFLGCDDHLAELAFFPAMGLTSDYKMEVISHALQRLTAYYHVLPLGRYAQEVSQHAHLKQYQP
ncbi:MAG: polysaccharide deacetylase [Candidatus Entotheonella factor]|uniref:Polysaccharide deacetylase n=1 Tax=Entotheonella factor TaxID=1429438 RepID=W4L7L2_ENTF1|nr:MAG: polysaccharide deacetylase [Candidatus Entotheonella factor]